MNFDWTPYFSAFWILPIVCLIFMAIMMFGRGCLSSHAGHRSRRGDGGETAREILDRRYASGEIGMEQYDAMRRALNQ